MAARYTTSNVQKPIAIEVTVISAESLKNPATSFLLPRRRLRPYAAVSSSTTTAEPHRTRIDDYGGANPIWNDTLSIPIDTSFVHGGEVHVTILSSHRRLGVCHVTAADVLDGFHAPDAPRRLSYALRDCRHGGTGHGIVHLLVRIVGADKLKQAHAVRPAAAVTALEKGWPAVALGIPMRVPLPAVDSCMDVNCDDADQIMWKMCRNSSPTIKRTTHQHADTRQTANGFLPF